MFDLCKLIVGTVIDLLRSRAMLEAEILMLRQQINVLRRANPKRLRFASIDRLSIWRGGGGPPSLGWKTFLRNHADGIVAMDLFVVPTISFRLLYGLLIMGHGRRQILWFGVTSHPTAEWMANQLTEACGWEQAPRYLIRDRDGVFGELFVRRLRSMGIRDRPTSPRSPWQNGFAERLIGSIRRECLDHVVVFGERHLRHILLSYMKYYNEVRTHLSLEKDTPVSRAVERTGHILCRPALGGLRHQYIRIC